MLAQNAATLIADVLHRLIEGATHSLELRAIIAAHLQHVRQQRQGLGHTAAA